MNEVLGALDAIQSGWMADMQRLDEQTRQLTLAGSVANHTGQGMEEMLRTGAQGVLSVAGAAAIADPRPELGQGLQQDADAKNAPPASGTSVCAKCGGAMSAGDRFCGQCGARAQPVRHLCPGCGMEAKLGARFCRQCGGSLAVS